MNGMMAVAMVPTDPTPQLLLQLPETLMCRMGSGTEPQGALEHDFPIPDAIVSPLRQVFKHYQLRQTL